ncbi:hypothetical protein VNI00_000757 [Paramarasmius palmivorus]|uniref:Uncharacterized protein n=1 Tax=Paramarasmius palmivorus TaxID=297713 RepID=A0AAW0E9H7_9AGAR
MVAFSALGLFAISVILGRVSSSPVAVNATGSVAHFEGLELDHQAREILARATPAAPHWVVYADTYVQGTNGPPPVSALKGFNVFCLSFLLIEGAWDKAYEWTTLTADERASIKSQYAAAGIKLVVSAFGATERADVVQRGPNCYGEHYGCLGQAI